MTLSIQPGGKGAAKDVTVTRCGGGTLAGRARALAAHSRLFPVRIPCGCLLCPRCRALRRQRVTVNPVVSGVCASVSPSVVGGPSEALGGKVGYVKLSTFSSQTVPKFQDALEELKKQVGGCGIRWVWVDG